MSCVGTLWVLLISASLGLPRKVEKYANAAVSLKATTGIEPVLSPLRPNSGFLRLHMRVGSPWQDMSEI